MLKTNSVMSAKIISSPSPDRKAANRIKRTNSPCKEIQKYLINNPKYKKSKILIKSNVPNSPNNSVMHHPADLLRISQLEKQVEQYRRYVQEYEMLAERNKKMEQQMHLILKELERRNATMKPSPKNNRFNTFQTSQELQICQHKEMQLEDLYEYITEMEGTIHNLANQNREMEMQIRKNVKKDMNDMEKRLMGYIFGLEEKLSSATSRNHQIMKSLQTFRPYSFHQTSRKNTVPNIQDNCISSQREQVKKSQGDSQIWRQWTTDNKNLQNQIKSNNNNLQNSSNSSQINIIDLENSITDSIKQSLKGNQNNEQSPAQSLSNKKQNESLVSMRNIQVSSSFRTPTLEYSKTFFQSSSRRDHIDNLQQRVEIKGYNNVDENEDTLKKQRTQSMSLKLDSRLCENCIKYMKELEYLRNENQKLRKDRKELREQISRYEQKLTNFREKNNRQEESSKLSSDILATNKKINKSKSSQLAQKLSVLQSNINIIVDTSMEQSVNIGTFAVGEDLGKSKSSSDQVRSGPSSSDLAQKFLILEKVKTELINVMQSIQELVHVCGIQPKSDSLLAELRRKQKMQEMLIGELEEEMARLRMELQDVKNRNEKLQKLWKTQIKEQEDMHYSPRNTGVQSFVSCVNPSVTKQKIDRILKSIRSFEDQYNNSTYP